MKTYFRGFLAEKSPRNTDTSIKYLTLLRMWKKPRPTLWNNPDIIAVYDIRR